MTSDEAKTIFTEALKKAIVSPHFDFNNAVTRVLYGFAFGRVPSEKYDEMIANNLDWEQITISCLTKDNNTPYELPNNKVLTYSPDTKRWTVSDKK